MLKYLTAPIRKQSIIEWQNYIYGKHGFFMVTNGHILIMYPHPDAPDTPGQYFDRKLKPANIVSPFPNCFELKERFDFNLGRRVAGFESSGGVSVAHGISFREKYVGMVLGRLESFQMFLTKGKHPALCVYFNDGVSAYVMPMVGD